jgi:hypothetical protein
MNYKKILPWLLFILMVWLVAKATPAYVTGNLTGRISCQIKGGEWSDCYRSMGPCGCFKKYSDGGEKCTKSSDCLAGSCVIYSKRVNKNTDKEIVTAGECPQYGRYDGFFLGCGEAKIDSGKILEDMRGCVY